MRQALTSWTCVILVATFVCGFLGLVVSGFWLMALGYPYVPHGILLAAAIWVSLLAALLILAAVFRLLEEL